MNSKIAKFKRFIKFPLCFKEFLSKFVSCFSYENTKEAFIKMKKFAIAFSLVELIISIITISCISAAFTPVVTKKMITSQTKMAGGAGGLRKNCSEFSSDCQLCTDKACIICSKDSKAKDGTYLDVQSCSYKSCNDTAKFGTGCLTCTSEECTMCTAGSYYINNKKCTACGDNTCDGKRKCNKNCATCTQKGAEGCTSCKTGYYLNGTTCTACSNIDSNCTDCSNSSTCTACVGGYYPSGSKCTPTGCAANQYNTGKTCKPCTDFHAQCTTCYKKPNDGTNVCTKCQSGFYATGSTCVNCNTLDTHCKQCSNSTTCVSCDPGY